jgi:hypothetical protein
MEFTVNGVLIPRLYGEKAEFNCLSKRGKITEGRRKTGLQKVELHKLNSSPNINLNVTGGNCSMHG